MRKILLIFACLMTLLTAAQTARADRATPIIEQGNRVGDRTKTTGYIVAQSVNPKGATRFLVIVSHGCMPSVLYTIAATAKKGVVGPEHVGRIVRFTVVVTAEISVNENGWVQGEVQILEVESLAPDDAA